MKHFYVVVIIVLLSGCTQLQLLPYLDQALMLKALSQEKEQQHKFVSNTDGQYDKLKAAVASGHIKEYRTEQGILKAFGPPIEARIEEMGGKKCRQALYRYAIWRQAKDKIYLYYDDKGDLLKWESQPILFY